MEIHLASGIKFIERLYRRFNARDIEALLSMMSEDVIWANGMEGGHVRGREGVRSYWARQWGMIDPHVEPISSSLAPTVRSRSRFIRSSVILGGQLLSNKRVWHIFKWRTA